MRELHQFFWHTSSCISNTDYLPHKIITGNILAGNFINFLADVCVHLTLLLVLHINHMDNSNSADSYQSSLLLHRETVTGKTQAALMMARGARLFFSLSLQVKHMRVRSSVSVTPTQRHTTAQSGTRMDYGQTSTHAFVYKPKHSNPDVEKSVQLHTQLE